MLNGQPMPESAVCRLLGLDNQILTTTLTTLLTYGVASRCEETGAIMSRRMVRDEEIRQVRKSCGKMGGNPNLVNQKPTTGVKVELTPSSSSSSSTSVKEEEGAGNPARPPAVKPKQKQFEEDSIPYQAAVFFWEYLKDWAPSAKEPSKSGYQAWAKDFDLILRIDHRTTDEINELLDWINNKKESRDGFSWRKNIHSPRTLREKWNQGKFADFLPRGLAKEEFR